MIDRPIQWHDIVRGDPGLPPLLMLHGFMGAGADWMDAVDDFSLQHRCICPDLPGHGSTRGTPVGMAQTADSLLQRLDSMGIERCAVVGYSLGGRLALYMAVHHPDRFSRVVLESASPGLRTEEAQTQRRERDEALAEELLSLVGDPYGFLGFVNRWYQQPHFENTIRQEGRIDQLLDRRMRNNPAALADVLRTLGTGSQPSLWEALESYSVPTLALVGELDRKFCFIAEAMSEACPNIAKHEVEGCSHNIHFENPRAFVTVVSAFLNPAGESK